MSVIKFEIEDRVPYAEGKIFGETGAYERIYGKITFAVDPLHERNEGIVDLEFTPRDSNGLVRAAADVSILAPVNLDKGNGRLLVDVPNRGNPLLMRSFNKVTVLLPEDRLKPGDGFLFKRGYTLVSIGWQWDAHGEGSLRLEAPEAVIDGVPITGQVISEFRPASDLNSLPLIQLGQEKPSYPVLDPDSEQNRLYVLEYEDGPRQLLPRSDWKFARQTSAGVAPSENHIYLAKGFEKGKIYQLVHIAQGAPVVGMGLLAIREIAAFLRYGDNLSPLSSEFKHVLAFGVSQTGRVLREFLYSGLNRDQEERIVYDGMLIHIAGAQRGDFNHRFAQPTVLAIPSFGQRFPFAAVNTSDPFEEQNDSLFEKLEKIDAVPYVFFTNTSWEYWRGDASLIHIAPDGENDLEEHPKTRIYMAAGTHHIGGILVKGKQVNQLPEMGGVAEKLNVVNLAPFVRAALVNLDRWVSEGTSPPASKHPKISDNTAVPRETVLKSFERFAEISLLNPEKLSVLRKLDLGHREIKGIGEYPAKESDAYPCFVSAIDEDFNEISGIRLPDISVPVGTHTGWNPRAPETGAPDLASIFMGFTSFFKRSPSENEKDPRASMEERYAGKKDYLAKVKAAAMELAASGYLLEEDVDWVIQSCSQRYDAALR